MFLTHSALAGGHRSKILCHRERGLKQKRAIKEDTRKAREVVFTVEGFPIDSESWFVYLCRFLSADDDDWPVVLRNMVKARQRWAYISQILCWEGATPRISAMFYKAVVQTVLICGYESWVLTPSMLEKLEGFHLQVARRLTGHASVYLRNKGTWQYQPLGNAMEEAGLYSMNEYINRLRNNKVDYMATQPIYTMCHETERRGLNQGHQYWWNQDGLCP
jgi:hypothetical protein